MRSGTARIQSGPGKHRAVNAAPFRPGLHVVEPFPAIFFLSGAGLLICSLADALSRGTVVPAMGIYWAGILVISVPIFYRLTSRDASDRERLALVALLGLSLYGVKVLRDAPMFTFNDELIHAFNAQQIASHKHLFHENPILEVTPYYPGLEGATSALVQLSGLSIYTAGTVLVAAARLSLITALFFLFRRVSGSARTAGLGAAIYAGNFNFFFYSAQYSYESLALPLLVVVLMLLAERETSPRQRLRDWAPPIGLGIAAIVVTHHLTSYALFAVIAALAVASWACKRSWRPPNPWPFAIFTGALALGWLLIAAGSTVGYLKSPLTSAIEAIGNTVSGEAPPRGLFQSGSSYVAPTPLDARAVAVAAVAVLAICLPFGLFRLWQRQRRQPFVIVFSLAALGFFATLALRLAPAAWETGNRASEFFFIGLAFVVASAGLQNWKPRSSARLGRAVATLALAVILIGGAISGWPWDTQLAQPLRVAANGGDIVSQPLSLAEWASGEVPGGRFAAPTADANMLLFPGDKTVLTGSSPDVADVLTDPTLASWQLPLLRHNDLRYVVVDRRKVSADGIRGYYFSQDDSSDSAPLLPDSVVTKFQRVPGAARIYSNGAITVYDLEGKR
jgi:hypothetical protein